MSPTTAWAIFPKRLAWRCSVEILRVPESLIRALLHTQEFTADTFLGKQERKKNTKQRKEKKIEISYEEKEQKKRNTEKRLKDKKNIYKSQDPQWPHYRWVKFVIDSLSVLFESPSVHCLHLLVMVSMVGWWFEPQGL